jgi:endo-1,4-beta-xylanase
MEPPPAVLKEEAVLFQGPGNADYKTLKILDAGEKVTPTGFFGDFVKVSAGSVEGDVAGFVHRSSLGGGTSFGEALAPEDVPLKPLFDPACSQVKHLYDDRTDTITLDNTKNGEGFDTNSAEILLESPLQIRVAGMQVLEGWGGSLKITGAAGGPDTAGDPWWRNLLRMDLTVGGDGNYLIRIMDGTREDWVFSLAVSDIPASQPIRIAFDQPNGGSFTIFDANHLEVAWVDLTAQKHVRLPNGLFPERKVSIGTSMNSRAALTVTGLEVGVLPDGGWTAGAQEYPGLAGLADRKGIAIGTIIDDIAYQNTRHCRTLDRNFNLVFVGAMDDYWTWLGRNRYAFSELDKRVDFAAQKGWRVRASILYGRYETIPPWLRAGSYSRQEYLQILEEHVRSAVSHFKGRVQEWIIANEVVNLGYAGNDADFWLSRIGPEYVGEVFRWAREEDPEAVLILNDFDNESPRTPNHRLVIHNMLELVEEWKAQGVPIDAVGMQMHLLVPQCRIDLAPKKEDVLDVMRSFGDLGTTVSITEFDVTIYQCPGSRGQQLDFQAAVYKAMMEACLESGICTDFTTWGVSDNDSWLNQVCPQSWCINNPGADPLLFDGEYLPKPAYFALREVLEQFPS